MIFGRERLYTLNAADTAVLKSSYSTVVLFVVDVESNGDLNYNGNHLIVQNGKYVGDPAWGTRLAALKTAPTTVSRIEVCTGGAGARSFVHIQDLIAAQGIGPSSILYKNFQVLKKTLGIDAIDYDDEVDYDADSAVAFGNLVASLGMHVTLCPYNYESYWQDVHSRLGPVVDAVYLQCYDGGAYNDPAYWNTLFGGLIVQPGDWNQNSVATVQSEMAGWRKNDGITGGFIWLLDDMSSDSARQYAAAVNVGIGGPTALSAAGVPGGVALSWSAAPAGGTYRVYRGTSAGSESATPIQSGLANLSYTDRSAAPGVTYYYKVTSFGPGGAAAPANEASAAAAPAPLPTISGTASLQGVASGLQSQPLVFTLTPTGTTAGSAASQTVTTASNGAFTLANVPVGTYTLSVKGSKWLRKSVSVDTTSGSVSGVSIALRGGDLNGDNLVSFADFIVLRNALGSSAGKANWNPTADLDGDGQVTKADLSILQSNYGKRGDK